MQPSATVKPRVLVIDHTNAGTISVVAKRTLGVEVRDFSKPEDLMMNLRPHRDAFVFCNANTVPLYVDLLGAVREVDPKIPFFYLSVLAHPKEVERALKGGASGWIVRPCGYPWLVGTLYRHFDCWRRDDGAPFSMNPIARSQVRAVQSDAQRRSAEALNVPVVLDIDRADLRHSIESCLEGALSPFGLDPRWLHHDASCGLPHASFLRTAALVITHPHVVARPRQKPIINVLEDYRDHVRALRARTSAVICAVARDLPALEMLEMLQDAGADYVLSLPMQWRHLAPIGVDALNRWLG